MPQPTILNAATGQWVHAGPIAAPTGGTTTDTQSRTAIGGILAALRDAGVIAGATHLPSSQQWNGTLKQIVLGPAITGPTGGTPDADLRTAVGSVIAVLQGAALVNGGTTGPNFVLDPDNLQMATAGITDLNIDGTGDDNARTALNSALAAMRLAELIA